MAGITPHLACCALAAAVFMTQPVAAKIRYIDYHVDHIPNILAAEGIASEIIFEEDEKIIYTTFGFDAAWEHSVVSDHILIFIPKAEDPQTNLLVHTDKRHYVFTITTANNAWEKHPDNSGAYYSTRIRYHDSKSIAAKKAEENATELRHRDISPPSSYLYTNYDYRATANAGDLIPHRIWDNGTLTFIAFRAGAKRGVAYERQADGKTALVNQHTERNGLLVIHGIYQHLLLRLGDEAVELRRNHIYGQRENQTKTTVEATRRVDKDGAPTQWQDADAVTEQPRAQVFSEADDPQPRFEGFAAPTEYFGQ